MSIRQLASLGRWHGNRLTLKHDDCDDWTAFKRCMNGDGCTRSWTMQHPYLQHTSQGWQLVCVCVSRLPHPRCCVLITVDVSAHGLLATVQVYLLRLRIPPLLPASCCQSNTHTHTHTHTSWDVPIVIVLFTICSIQKVSNYFLQRENLLQACYLVDLVQLESKFSADVNVITLAQRCESRARRDLQPQPGK